MKVAVIAGTNLRRFVRDRSNVFFVFIFPLALVLLIGLQFGEDQDPRLGIVAGDDDVSRAIIEQLRSEDEIDLRTRSDRDDLVAAVEDGDLAAGVVVPEGIGALAHGGGPYEIGFFTTDTGIGPQLRAIVDDAVARARAEPTAVATAVARGADVDAARASAARHADLAETIEVRTSTTGDRLFPEDLSGYDIGAPGQLVLFVFLTSLTGSAALIQSRRLGLTTRMMSTPTPLRTIIAGEALGRFAIAFVQGAYILVASIVLFGVDWGDPLGAIAVLALFAAVGAAGAMIVGAVFRNDQQASGVMILVSLALAAIGGAMLPIEFFSDTLRTIAELTPHYWALDAYAELIRHDGALVDVLPQLGVLAAFAVVLGVVAAGLMRAALTRR